MKEILIDGELILTKGEMHDLLAEKLGFPEWYGRNLDALHDCLTDIKEDVLIRVVNFDDLDEHLPIYGKLAVRVIRRACHDNPHLSCEVDRDDIDDGEEDED